MSAAGLKVLYVEDNETDFLLIGYLLNKVFSASLDLTRAGSLDEAGKRLKLETFDLILLDLDLPDSKGITTVEIVQGLAPFVPILVLSGLSEEQFGVQCLQSGAQDFLVKGQIDSLSLLRAFRYALERKKFYAQEKLVQELQDALAKVQTLEELLPICASCKRIRDDQGYWSDVEKYFHAHCHLNFTHGICPDCMEGVRNRMRGW